MIYWTILLRWIVIISLYYQLQITILEKKNYQKFSQTIEKLYHGKQNELQIIYEKLTSNNQDKVLHYSKNLLSNQQMEEELAAAHARTDITPTPEGQAHDNAIMDDDSEWE